jgi:hypothetical protein
MVDQYPFGLGTQPSSRSIDREGRQTYAQPMPNWAWHAAKPNGNGCGNLLDSCLIRPGVQSSPKYLV